MKRLIFWIVGLAVLGALVAPAFAQEKEDDPIVIEQKRKKQEAEEVDKRYKSTLEKTRGSTPAAPRDPWSNMRGDDDSKTKR